MTLYYAGLNRVAPGNTGSTSWMPIPELKRNSIRHDVVKYEGSTNPLTKEELYEH
jgi:hypothetical protein